MPTDRDLAARFRVTGVDLSVRQIDAARAAVPSGTFLVADMTSVAFAPASFDAVVALYSMIHIRLMELPDLLERIHEWLRPGGRLLVTLGTVEGQGIEEDWLGVPMFFAGQSPESNLASLRTAGFAVEAESVETTAEPEGDVRFHWILARRP